MNAKINITELEKDWRVVVARYEYCKRDHAPSLHEGFSRIEYNILHNTYTSLAPGAHESGFKSFPPVPSVGV